VIVRWMAYFLFSYIAQITIKNTVFLSSKVLKLGYANNKTLLERKATVNAHLKGSGDLRLCMTSVETLNKFRVNGDRHVWSSRR
jgi:hypothetical protein